MSLENFRKPPKLTKTPKCQYDTKKMLKLAKDYRKINKKLKFQSVKLTLRKIGKTDYFCPNVN